MLLLNCSVEYFFPTMRSARGVRLVTDRLLPAMRQRNGISVPVTSWRIVVALKCHRCPSEVFLMSKLKKKQKHIRIITFMAFAGKARIMVFRRWILQLPHCAVK